MNIIDLRKNLFTSPANQRTGDRRKNPHPFGSQEWRDYLYKNGLEPPTFDRRKTIRRASDQQAQAEIEPSERPYARILLTPAEKKLLVDMYLTDLK
ncbi:MAG: hypothetical protein WAW36_11845 [Methylovulum miyakonense]|uniref:hypothetical protein n=1 Tax=Methylovulum miyakonense TaxID=645578 RepID=UPI003BB72885